MKLQYGFAILNCFRLQILKLPHRKIVHQKLERHFLEQKNGFEWISIKDGKIDPF